MLNLSTSFGTITFMTRPAGFHHSEETKRKISESQKGKVITDEMRKNMSLAHIGKPSPRKNQIPLICQFCGGDYTKSLSMSKGSKFCSRLCQNRSYAQRQEKYPLELYYLLKVYRGIIHRCTNPKSDAYHNYGGRGITVASEWLDINVFISDMLPGYKKGLTIDRVDNSKGYSKENCRWATRKEQMQNFRGNKVLTYGGTALTITQWADKLGVSRRRLADRIYHNWPIEKALFAPINTSKRNKGVTL